ncbi:diphosphomevalonate/mevalonate 3,5-bisphosphate decarboxylase family protein [Saccharicrinis sp. FJH62]|uniref:diphosphomevalonate/mevalonate 3,5-bisphosphate decarboxylase family protein n=1 Tax=Saccharicrinis sp. FJH62 TaxID=3344657 RepID=UPI0035D50569
MSSSQTWKKVAWRSPSNIALIKYWGKYGRQLPRNPSISMTLKNCYTETEMEYRFGNVSNGPVLDFRFQGKHDEIFAARIMHYLDDISNEKPFLKNLEMKVSSSNSFPHSAGVASSASSMSAFVLCLLVAENEIMGIEKDEEDFLKEASSFSRLASGSAARSLYGGFVIWGESAFIPHSSSKYALPVTEVAPVFQTYRDAVMIVSSKKKTMASTRGHKLMEDHPFAQERYGQARVNLSRMIEILRNGDQMGFAELLEHEALTLHSLMMSSIPGYIEIKANTINIIDRIREYREKSGVPLAFTLDAGPNVHILYPEEDKEEVIYFIKHQLKDLCENKKWIDDEMGTGPERLI